MDESYKFEGNLGRTNFMISGNCCEINIRLNQNRYVEDILLSLNPKGVWDVVSQSSSYQSIVSKELIFKDCAPNLIRNSDLIKILFEKELDQTDLRKIGGVDSIIDSLNATLH